MNNYKSEKFLAENKIDFQLPRHIGIIMDGNGRWAKKRLLPRNAGHKAGMERLRGIVETVGLLGIDSLTVYAFSTENWNRSDEEVSGLMKLLLDYFENFMNMLMEKHVRICHLGETERLSLSVLNALNTAVEKTKNNDGLTLNLAFNYGSRAEIVHAVKEIAKLVKDNSLDINDINERMISEHLYTKNQPDPDLIIRTSGEIRLSNFLLYQAAYSEIITTKTLWPDFSNEELIDCLREFSKRDRRFGKSEKN